MSLSFNQFVKELRDRGIRDQEAYIFTLIYERLIETEKLVLESMQVLNQMADSMAGFAQLHEADRAALQKVLRGGHEEDAAVESVAFDPGKNN